MAYLSAEREGRRRSLAAGAKGEGRSGRRRRDERLCTHRSRRDSSVGGRAILVMVIDARGRVNF